MEHHLTQKVEQLDLQALVSAQFLMHFYSSSREGHTS